MFRWIIDAAIWILIGVGVGIVLFAPAARADEVGSVRLTLPITAYHFQDNAKYNNKNLGVGVEYTVLTDVRLKSVIYNNSRNIESMFIGGVFTPLSMSVGGVKIEGGFMAGKVSGYAVEPILIALPAARVEWKQHGMNMAGLPNARGSTGGIGFEYTYRF